MKKIIIIEGMSCEHCKKRVEDALNSIDGVKARVDLKRGAAVVKLNGNIDDEVLKDAVSRAGYKVLSIDIKKGLFG